MKQVCKYQLKKIIKNNHKIKQNLLAITKKRSLSRFKLRTLKKFVKLKKSSIKAALNPYISNLFEINNNPVNIGASS